MIMQKQHNWIPANLKPEVMIKEKDSEFHNVLFERILIGADKKRPITRRWVQVLRPQDYRKYFVDCDQERKTKYLKSMNVDAAELVHDPDKIMMPNTIRAPKPGPKTALTQKEKLQAKAQELGIEGWESMSASKLRNAINESGS